MERCVAPSFYSLEIRNRGSRFFSLLDLEDPRWTNEASGEAIGSLNFQRSIEESKNLQLVSLSFFAYFFLSLSFSSCGFPRDGERIALFLSNA